MLVSNSSFPSDGDIVSLKLGNGEEVVGKMVSQTDDAYLMDRPLSLAMTGRGEPGLRPFMVTVHYDTMQIAIPKSHVIGVAPTRKEIEDEYIRNTTGIEIVTGGSL